jgi:hypothetical protein
MRALLEKIKTFKGDILRKVLNFGTYCKKTLLKVWRFLKKWGLHIVNLIVVIMAYDFYDDSLLVGGWLFFLLTYYIFWKLLGAEKLSEKDDEGELPI